MKRVLIFTLLFLLLPACSQKRPDDLPRLYPVKLTFMQESTPLVEAMVSLKAKERTTHYTCGGMTDKNGTVVVQTHGRYHGAPEGTYTVTVTKSVRELTGPWGEAPTTESERRTWLHENRHRLKEESYRTVDPKYADAGTSDLEVVVTRSGTKTTFDLGAPVRLELEPSHFR